MSRVLGIGDGGGVGPPVGCSSVQFACGPGSTGDREERLKQEDAKKKQDCMRTGNKHAREQATNIDATCTPVLFVARECVLTPTGTRVAARTRWPILNGPTGR